MFWENFLQLCNDKNKSPNAVCADIGLSNATASEWKKGRTPHQRTLLKIASYFNVPVESLTQDKKTPVAKSGKQAGSDLPPEAEQLLLYYYRLNDGGRRTLRGLAEDMVLSGKYVNKTPSFLQG